LPAERQIAGAASMRQKPKEADPDKAPRQDVQQEPPQEFIGADRHGARLAAVPVILPAKGHGVVRDIEEAMIRDGDAVGVAGQIVQHMFGAAEGRFGVDDPVVPKESSQERPKCARIQQWGQATWA
jgi:hypothetical protein